ncbi:glycosyltransferase [Nonomuraea sp. NPDC046570]|uniref:glycosyltransferase n=1 Tax=Nonomuraea sp. NPDC046570 TaxID=3155255 RepID=UPI0033FEBFF7
MAMTRPTAPDGNDPVDGGRPSVLHVTQPVDGGVAVYVAAVAGDQARRGWNVAVACPAGGPLRERLGELGVRWLEWSARRSPGPDDLGSARRLRRLVGGFGPQAVHLHSSKAGMVGRAVIRGAVPTIFQPHGWSWLACQGAMAKAVLSWERWAARWADLLVCVGEGEARLAGERGLSGPLTVVRNGVDLDRFRPAGGEAREAARRRYGLAERAPLAVCVGRVTRQKGQDLLVAAWERVRESCPDATLAIVGDGDLRDGLRPAAGPGVVFADQVDDPRAWYAAADVVVLPSRWEGLPLTALEALASGRCLVASDIPGLAELVTGEIGEVVPVGETGPLAEALARRLGDLALAREEGRAAAIRAQAFDLGPALDLLADHTLRLVGSTGVVRAGDRRETRDLGVASGGPDSLGGESRDLGVDSSGSDSLGPATGLCGFTGGLTGRTAGTAGLPNGPRRSSRPQGRSGSTEEGMSPGIEDPGEPDSVSRKARAERAFDGQVQTPCGQ